MSRDQGIRDWEISRNRSSGALSGAFVESPTAETAAAPSETAPAPAACCRGISPRRWTLREVAATSVAEPLDSTWAPFCQTGPALNLLEPRREGSNVRMRLSGDLAIHGSDRRQSGLRFRDIAVLRQRHGGISKWKRLSWRLRQARHDVNAGAATGALYLGWPGEHAKARAPPGGRHISSSVRRVPTVSRLWPR